jgi:ABC-type nitrate/sulfonate/bicarbonate transport system permease component
VSDLLIGLFTGFFLGLAIGTPLGIELVFRRQQFIKGQNR